MTSATHLKDPVTSLWWFFWLLAKIRLNLPFFRKNGVEPPWKSPFWGQKGVKTESKSTSHFDVKFQLFLTILLFLSFLIPFVHLIRRKHRQSDFSEFREKPHFPFLSNYSSKKSILSELSCQNGKSENVENRSLNSCHTFRKKHGINLEKVWHQFLNSILYGCDCG